MDIYSVGVVCLVLWASDLIVWKPAAHLSGMAVVCETSSNGLFLIPSWSLVAATNDADKGNRNRNQVMVKFGLHGVDTTTVPLRADAAKAIHGVVANKSRGARERMRDRRKWLPEAYFVIEEREYLLFPDGTLRRRWRDDKTGRNMEEVWESSIGLRMAERLQQIRETESDDDKAQAEFLRDLDANWRNWVRDREAKK